MEPYRTSGTVDEAVLKEIIGIFVPVWYRRLTRTFCAVSLLLVLVFAFAAKKPLFAVLFLAFAAQFACYPALLRRRHFKLAIARLNEQAGSTSFRQESFFNVDGLAVHNPDTGGSILLRYDSFAAVRESKHYFTLLTEGQQYTLIFKDCLTDEQLHSFLPDLKQHCPKLRIRR